MTRRILGKMVDEIAETYPEFGAVSPLAKNYIANMTDTCDDNTHLVKLRNICTRALREIEIEISDRYR